MLSQIGTTKYVRLTFGIEQEQPSVSPNRMLAIFCVAMVFAWTKQANACSCVPSSLESHYASAPHIFTAIVTGTEKLSCDATEDDRACRDKVYTVTVEPTQVFKGRPNAVTIRADSNGASCSASLVVGEEYIFFISDNGYANTCSGTRAVTDRTTGQDHWVLTVLRDYVAGATADLSMPWFYTETGTHCFLRNVFDLVGPGGDMSYGTLLLEYQLGEDVSSASPVPKGPGYIAAYLELPGPATHAEGSFANLVIGDAAFRFDAPPEKPDLRATFSLPAEDALDLAFRLDSEQPLRLGASTRSYPRIDMEIRRSNAGDNVAQFLNCVSPF